MGCFLKVSTSPRILWGIFLTHTVRNEHTHTPKLKPANGVSHVSVSVNRDEFGITTIDTHHEASEMLSVMCGDDDLAARSTKRALETSSAEGR